MFLHIYKTAAKKAPARPSPTAGCMTTAAFLVDEGEADELAAVAVSSPSPDVIAGVLEAAALAVEVTRVEPLAVELLEDPDPEPAAAAAVLVPEPVL